MGSDHILFGSDSPWYGAPQWQIDAFWRFQIPEELRQKYGYPRLTKRDKRKILGINAARLYGLIPKDSEKLYKPVPENFETYIPAELNELLEYTETTGDNFSRARDRMLAQGLGRSDARYGWIYA
jgi:hypothetical protein